MADQDRADRLAQALRANLRRRKAQARALAPDTTGRPGEHPRSRHTDPDPVPPETD